MGDSDALSSIRKALCPAAAETATLSGATTTTHVTGVLVGSGITALDECAYKTVTETALVKIFCDVLQRENVVVHDSFLDLGGDSVMALSIVGRVREMGVPLELQDLLQHSDIRSLARHIATLRDLQTLVNVEQAPIPEQMERGVI